MIYGGGGGVNLILPHPNFAFFGCPKEVKWVQIVSFYLIPILPFWLPEWGKMRQISAIFISVPKRPRELNFSSKKDSEN